MNVTFYVSEGKDREELLARSLAQGANVHGDLVDIRTTASFDGKASHADVGCTFGVKRPSKAIVDSYVNAGKRVLMFDKALIRVPGADSGAYYKVGLDGPNPNKYLGRLPASDDRWQKLGIALQPRQRATRGQIVFAGSSQKYCDFHGLGEANDFARHVLAECHRRQPPRQLIYRPKPSFTGFTPIDNTTLSRPPETLSYAIAGAWALVTHGSSAAIDAVLNGVPAIVLSKCAASDISSGCLDEIENPYWAPPGALYQRMANLAYCQWTLPEFASGEAWQFLRNEIGKTK